jgi:hypothetical protein
MMSVLTMMAAVSALDTMAGGTIRSARRTGTRRRSVAAVAAVSLVSALVASRIVPAPVIVAAMAIASTESAAAAITVAAITITAASVSVAEAVAAEPGWPVLELFVLLLDRLQKILTHLFTLLNHLRVRSTKVSAMSVHII